MHTMMANFGISWSQIILVTYRWVCIVQQASMNFYRVFMGYMQDQCMQKIIGASSKRMRKKEEM